MACFIIINNRQDPWLSSFSNGVPRASPDAMGSEAEYIAKGKSPNITTSQAWKDGFSARRGSIFLVASEAN
jgi:hypothetical protein